MKRTDRTKQAARSLGWPLGVRRLLCLFSPFWLLWLATPVHAILAGGEFDLPEDRPSWRVDGGGLESGLNFVGALEMTLDGRRFSGTGAALSPNWVLTAGHNVDFDDDGVPDAGLAADFHLPGFGVFGAAAFWTHPDFTGFGNPTVHHDLALLYFDDPLPLDLNFPALGLSLSVGDVVTLAGFGRSGYGSYGYTTQAGTENRRVGGNTVESLEVGGDGLPLLFRYTFHGPDDPRSLGNTVETIIGPGDSGGPALVDWSDGLALAGISTFTEGFGGRFGDIGGGVVLEPYWEWIGETTGLAIIPEPATVALWLGILALVAVGALRRRGGAADLSPEGMHQESCTMSPERLSSTRLDC